MSAFRTAAQERSIIFSVSPQWTQLPRPRKLRVLASTWATRQGVSAAGGGASIWSWPQDWRLNGGSKFAKKDPTHRRSLTILDSLQGRSPCEEESGYKPMHKNPDPTHYERKA